MSKMVKAVKGASILRTVWELTQLMTMSFGEVALLRSRQTLAFFA